MNNAKNFHNIPTLIFFQILRTRIPDPILINGKQTIALWQTRAVVNLTDARLAPPLLQAQPRGTGVRDDIATDGFLRVRVEHGTGSTVDLGDNLIGNNDGDAEFVRETLERTHELGEVRLAGGELAAACEIGTVERGGRVDNEEGKAGLAHHGGGLVEELELVIAVVGASVGDVVEDLFAAEAVAVGDGQTADGTEGAFGVNVEAFAFTAAHVEG